MANELDYNELIDQYLKGTISEGDKKMFESRLGTDPVFKGEFELQKEVFRVIRTTRISQLKNMLSTVQVPWYYMISTGWKVAITAGAISLAGFSAYYLYHNQQEPDRATKIELRSSDIPAKSSPETLTLPAVKEPVNATESAKDRESIKADNSTEKEVKSAGKVTDKTGHKPESTNAENQQAEVNIPQPDLDQSAGNTSDNDLNVLDNNDFNSEAADRKMEEKVASVKIIKNKDYNFHYSFNEGALKLYGDFKGYEILGIHSSEGKDYFLFFNNKYYYLKQNTREIKPLELVRSQELINELNILKDNK